MNTRRMIFFVYLSIMLLTVPAWADGEGSGGERGHRHREEGHVVEQSRAKDAKGRRDDGHDHNETSAKSAAHRRKEEKKGGKEEAGHGHDGEEALMLDEQARQMINLRLARVEKKALKGRLKVFGRIAKDTANYSYARIDGEGVVERITTDLGRVVDPGEVLLVVRRSDGSLEEVKAPIHGIVLSIFVRPRDRVDSLTSLVSIMDVDVLRATIDIYEQDLRFVKEGQKVLLRVSAYPEKVFEGTVRYISPQVDEKTQSIKVRVDVDNKEHLLKLGMFIYGDLLYGAKDHAVVVVPDSAIQELNGESIVFVSENDRLEVREVTIGRKVDGYTEIRDGLEAGEYVVTQGSFYLKSEKAKASFGGGHSH